MHTLAQILLRSNVAASSGLGTADLKLRAKWHVGDTPMDIQAADGGQAKALGVLTGVYSRQDLEGCGAGNSCACDLHD